jgi:hypothetical protein
LKISENIPGNIEKIIINGTSIEIHTIQTLQPSNISHSFIPDEFAEIKEFESNNLKFELSVSKYV